MFLKTLKMSCTEQHTGCGHHSYLNLANVQLFWEILNHHNPTTVVFTRTDSGHGKVVWHIEKPLIISRMPQSWETHLNNNAHRQQSEITHHIKACVIHARGSQQSSAEQTK